MATQDYKNFIANIKTVGLPTGSRYYVQIPGGDDTRTLCMLIDQITLPGLSLMTTEMRTWGEIREAPYGIAYPPVTMSIIMDNKSTAKLFFDAWANSVFDRNTRAVGYYENFIKDVKIMLTDKEDYTIYSINLREAFPKTISDIQLDYSSKDIIRLNVTLAYRYWDRDVITGLNSPAEIIEGIRNSSRIDNLGSGPSNQVGGTRSLSGIISSKTAGVGMQLMGPTMSSALSTVNSGAANSCRASGLNSGNSNFSGLSTQFNNLTSSTSLLGSGIGNLGASLRNVLAPISSIATAVSGIGGTLSSINTLTNSLGLGSPFSSIVTNLNSASVRLGTVSNLRGVPQNLSSVGSSIYAMGTQFGDLAKSMGELPGASSKLQGAYSALGATYREQGSEINNVSDKITESPEYNE